MDNSLLSFAGKLVVITGVGRAGQVGEAIADRFAQLGASLALLDLQQDQVNERAQELRTRSSQGGPITAHAANLADPGETSRVAAELLAQHPLANGAVHAVICAAGGFGMTGPIDAVDPAAWSKQFTINLETAFSITRALLPAVRAARGSFVYFGSAAVLPGGSSKGMAAYAAAKSGVLSLMRTVSMDERVQGVRANAVAPTAVRTTSNLADMGDKTEYVERESVADVVAMLASPIARNITGQVLLLA